MICWKRNVKKMSVLLVSVLMMFSLFGCANIGDEKDKFTIGVMQYSEADSLSDCYRGFVDGLAENGYISEDNVNIVYKSAEGDAGTAATIADYFVNKNCDLIFSLTTVNSLAIKEKNTEIPVVMCSVTEPEHSGLVNSNEKPGGNMTGMSDLCPVSGQVELLSKLVPDVKSVGILYCSSETNAKPQAEKFMKELEHAGIGYIDASVSQIDEVKLTIDSIADKVDALYVAPDNVMVASAKMVSNAAIDANLPIISSYGMVAGGALASYGVDYYRLGKESAQMALSILVDGENPGEIPIGYQNKDDMRATINETTAKKLKIEIPEEIAETAVFVK